MSSRTPIVVVEHQPIFRLALRTILSVLGLPIQEVHRGLKALRYLPKAPPPRAIIVASDLPDIDAEELLRALAGCAHLRDVPRLLCCDRPRRRPRAAHALLQRPLRLDSVDAALKPWLRTGSDAR